MTILKTKLEAYRREKLKTAVKAMPNFNKDDLQNDQVPLIAEQLPIQSQEQSDDCESRLCEKQNVIESADDDEVKYSKKNSPYYYAIKILSLLLWICLYGIAIEMGFGTVYFMVSMLVFIWLNTSSKPKKEGEPSAYSVFNPNCEAIDGTLDASQFEREIRYGIPSMH